MAVNINVPSQVKTFANLAAFPATGALKTIYIAEDTNKTYRWTGSVYVEVSAAGATGITIGTTAITSGTVGRVLFEGTGNVVQESANLFWDNTNGRLGIGTNAPSGRIHVKGSVASEIFKAESTIAALYAQFVSTDGAGEFGIYTDAFYFQPLSSLANGTRFLNGANTIIMQLAQTGNVLINTTTDAGFKLDVNGTARVNTLTIGLGGGQVSSNTAIGLQALNGNTTGARNVGLGQQSNFTNSTGVDNTAIGHSALFSNTANHNTAVGSSALYTNTGNHNSAFGRNAMISNSSGAQNTGIGRDALSANTTGSDNSALGYQTASGNFSGSTILGRGATATANNQFVIGSTGTVAGAVTSEVNASTQVWNVIINGVARKILLA